MTRTVELEQTYTERFLSSLMALISIFRLPIFAVALLDTESL